MEGVAGAPFFCVQATCDLVASPLAPFTTLYGGIRYQISRSNVSFDYDEAAIFVGLSHRFH